MQPGLIRKARKIILDKLVDKRVEVTLRKG